MLKQKGCYGSQEVPSAESSRAKGPLRLSVTKLSGDVVWEGKEVSRTALVADILFKLGATARDQLLVAEEALQLQARIGDIAGDANFLAANLIIVQADLFIRLACRIHVEGATEPVKELLVQGRRSDPQSCAAKLVAHTLNIDEDGCCFTEVHGEGALGDLYVEESYSMSVVEPESKGLPGTLSLLVVSMSQCASQRLLHDQAIELGTENPTRCMTVGKLAWTELNFLTKADWEADDDIYAGNNPDNRDGSRTAYGSGAPPLWRPHASRWGVNRSEISDGRVVWTGGQYEDSYDPQFCIFNDMLVEYPDGRAPELYTYPREVFPPTDYHACVEADGYLYLFGNVGYSEDRTPDQVQVLRLNLTTYAMDRVRTDGWSPPWLQGQRLTLRDTDPIDLHVGMTFFGGERPEVHFKGEPFGLLVKRGVVPEVVDDVPDGDDAEVCEHNIVSLSERFQVCYDGVQKLAVGMRFEFEDSSDDIKVRVVAESGELLGHLCKASDHYNLPLKVINEADMRYEADTLKDNIVEPPDFVLTNADALEDCEQSELFIAKPKASTVLGMKSDGPMQKVYESRCLTWQSVSLDGRIVVVSLYKGSTGPEFQKFLFNLDTLTWSQP